MVLVASRTPGTPLAGRSRQWLGAVPAAGVWTARQSLPLRMTMSRRMRRAPVPEVVADGRAPRTALAEPVACCPERDRTRVRKESRARFRRRHQ